jgi:hypothetical protein
LLKAAETLAPATSHKPKQKLYTTKYISCIRSQLNLLIPLDAAVYACLTTTFWATACVGKTTVPTLTSFDCNTHIKPSNVSKETDRQGLSQTAFFIPRTKSAPQGESITWAK